MPHARSVLKNLFPLLVLCICVILLWPRLSEMDAALLSQHWRTIGAGQWLGAALFTSLSFWAVSQYDVLAHRQLDTKISPSTARTAGLASIAIAQTTGFGLIVGTLVRWRLLRTEAPVLPAQITAFVSVMFMAALTAFTALLCLILPAPVGFFWVSIAALAALSGTALFALAQPRISLAGKHVDLPSLLAMSHALGWAALDVLAASAAFYLLFPSGLAPDLAAFLPVFCLALAAGLVSGTPGGVGPFELVFLGYTSAGMAADTDLTAAITAIVGFRLIYFAIPAVSACFVLVAPRRAKPGVSKTLSGRVSGPARAESAVVHQAGGEIEGLGSSHAALWPTGQALVCLFDPFTTTEISTFLRALKRRASVRNRFACVYKANRQTAFAARDVGWSVLHIADDAILELRTFTLDDPARARLRRKLRKATKSGVSVRRATLSDFDALAEIDQHWQTEHGRARGGTMGRFCKAYLIQQAVFIAEDPTGILGFVSFHQGAEEWALDLMRHSSDLPDGVMQTLVLSGITAAQAKNLARVSLSAVPACPDLQNALWRWVSRKAVIRAGGPGLRQFKSAFGPRWMPLYAAAPTRFALFVALADVTRAVVFPGPVRPVLVDTLQAQHSYPETDMSNSHDDDEYYEVASSRVA